MPYKEAEWTDEVSFLLWRLRKDNMRICGSGMFNNIAPDRFAMMRDDARMCLYWLQAIPKLTDEAIETLQWIHKNSPQPTFREMAQRALEKHKIERSHK